MKKHLSLLVLGWLRFWAKLQVFKIKPIIIGVTGSAGKSSCVAAIEAVIKDKYRVKTTGTTNSESGIPLAILGLKMNGYSFFDWLRVMILCPVSFLISKPNYQVLVAEMGIDELKPPKNMGYLLTIIQPKIGVFLNALPVHTLQMKSIENIAGEKGKLIQSLPKDGTAVLNIDDPLVAEYETKTAARVVNFGNSPRANIKNFLVGLPGYILTKDYGYTLAAAATVGHALGIPLEICKDNLKKNLRLPPGRASILAGINGSTIIDSSYNSSPAATKGALELLKNSKAKRKIAVLGDMRELGDLAETEHKKLAELAQKAADLVFTVGHLTKNYFPKSILNFSNSQAAGEYLNKVIKPGDLILVKGSQNTIFLEKVVEILLANPADINKLCRRGEYWEKVRG